MDPPEDVQRIRAARQEAVELGYMLIVDEAWNVEPPTYMAFAGPHIVGQPSMLRFLTNATSRADAAEAGLEILREIVAGRRSWPDE